MSWSPLSNSQDGDSPARAIYARNSARTVLQMMNDVEEVAVAPPRSVTDNAMQYQESQQHAFLHDVRHELIEQRRVLQALCQRLDVMERQRQAAVPAAPVYNAMLADVADASSRRVSLQMLADEVRQQRESMQVWVEATRAQLEALQRSMTMATKATATAAAVNSATAAPLGYVRSDTLVLTGLAIVVLLLVACTTMVAVLVARRSDSRPDPTWYRSPGRAAGTSTSPIFIS